MLRDASSTSEKTDQRILIMPVSSLGWVRPAAQAQQVRQSRSGLRLCSGSHLFRVRPEKCQGDAARFGTSDAAKIFFLTKKTPAHAVVLLRVIALSGSFGRRRSTRRPTLPRPKIYRRRGLGSRSGFVIRPRLRSRHFRGYRLRKLADVGIVVVNGLVIVLPRCRDSILGPRQF